MVVASPVVRANCTGLRVGTKPGKPKGGTGFFYCYDYYHYILSDQELACIDSAENAAALSSTRVDGEPRVLVRPSMKHPLTYDEKLCAFLLFKRRGWHPGDKKSLERALLHFSSSYRLADTSDLCVFSCCRLLRASACKIKTLRTLQDTA